MTGVTGVRLNGGTPADGWPWQLIALVCVDCVIETPASYSALKSCELYTYVCTPFLREVIRGKYIYIYHPKVAPEKRPNVEEHAYLESDTLYVR